MDIPLDVQVLFDPIDLESLMQSLRIIHVPQLVWRRRLNVPWDSQNFYVLWGGFKK
jgi:hypothetical protein